MLVYSKHRSSWLTTCAFMDILIEGWLFVWNQSLLLPCFFIAKSLLRCCLCDTGCFLYSHATCSISKVRTRLRDFFYLCLSLWHCVWISRKPMRQCPRRMNVVYSQTPRPILIQASGPWGLCGIHAVWGGDTCQTQEASMERQETAWKTSSSLQGEGRRNVLAPLSFYPYYRKVQSRNNGHVFY